MLFQALSLTFSFCVSLLLSHFTEGRTSVLIYSDYTLLFACDQRINSRRPCWLSKDLYDLARICFSYFILISPLCALHFGQITPFPLSLERCVHFPVLRLPWMGTRWVLLISLPIPSVKDPFEHCPLHPGEGQVWLAGECLLLSVLRGMPSDVRSEGRMIFADKGKHVSS